MATMSPETVRQFSATHNFMTDYQYIWVGIVGLLTIRRVLVAAFTRHHSTLIKQEATAAGSLEKGKEGGHPSPKSPTLARKIESWMYSPIISASWASLVTPIRAAVVVTVFAINLGFLLAVTIHTRPPYNSRQNNSHSVALRAGGMALANAPPVFALMGRNGLVAVLTGINPQHLRFVHKTLGYTWFINAMIHFLGMTLSSLVWSGRKGPKGLYALSYVRFGILTVLGLWIMVVFSLPFIRRRKYELFIATHIVGAICVLVGVHYHIEELGLRAWTWAAIAFWAFERSSRVIQLFSARLLAHFKARSPVIRARAELMHGAVVLRVPVPTGSWGPGQFAYVRLLDSKLLRKYPHLAFQAHPFSIANVPVHAPEGTKKTVADEMLFVMRIRHGMTRALANFLQHHGGSAELVVAIEGPYGGSSDITLYHDVLLVAAGSGITHIMSVLADLIQQAANEGPSRRTSKVNLVWAIQEMAQCDWIINDLYSSVELAHRANVELTIKFFVTRGGIDSPRNSSSAESLIQERTIIRGGARSGSLTGSGIDQILLHPATGGNTSVTAGRAEVQELVTAFVEESTGSSIVIACGPTKVAEDVRAEVARLSSTHDVVLEVASYEC